MEHLYNIVWADDNIDILLQDNLALFEKEGIYIHPFTEADSAIKYIRSNSSFVDAVITDAKFARRKGETFQEEGTSFPGLSEFIRHIDGLRRETGNPLPCWIFTGYGDLLWQKYEAEDLEGFNGVVDKKSNYNALKAWIKEMCSTIAETKTEAFRIRQENPECFALCDDRYIGKKCEKVLLDILSYKKDDEVDPFNRFRDILEEVLDLLVRKGIIGGLTEKTNINSRIDKFSSACARTAPQYIVPTMKLLLCSSALSHSDSTEKNEVIAGRAPYMYDTLVLALKTLLIWLKPFVDSIDQNASSPEVEMTATKEATESTDSPAEKPVDLSLLDASMLGTMVGSLTVKEWNVNIDGKYYKLDRKMVERTWRPGTRLRVRTGKDYKGNDIVTEVVRLEPR